jgi:putative ABC transport system permease protein
MFKTYFKLACRNILKHKGYSILNISGLAIGLASSILILLWVQNELSHNKFQKNACQIYRISGDLGDYKAAVNAEAMPAGLKAAIPVIKNTVRLSLINTVLLEADNRKFEEKRVFYADPSFMDVFSFPLVQGDRATALKRGDGVLITQEIAATSGAKTRSGRSYEKTITMGLNAATVVGKAFSFTGRKGMIVGVIKDFNFQPVQKAIEPLILR